MTNDQNGSVNVEVNFDDKGFKKSSNDALRVANAFSQSLTNAFVGVAIKGKSLGDVIDNIGLRLSRLALNLAFKPIENKIGDFLSPLVNGLSNIFMPASAAAPLPAVKPFAKGGVIAAPTFFQSGGGFGVAGERGAEAILPLSRGADGSLGVRVHEQAGAPSVTINIATPDVEGFRRSQSEIAAQLARMVSRGRRGN